MKKSIFAACAALALTGTLVAGGYDKYQVWQWMPVTVTDTNASDNVRHQEDFTVPLHGPWLTMPSETAMMVSWITTVPCAGGIEYREKGTEEWTAKWPVKYGQIDYSKDLHHFYLTGLKPATEYEYRLLSNEDNYTTAYYDVICRGREIHSFRTLDPKRDNYKIFLTSDCHGGFRLCLDPMIDNTGAADADFYFFLGDNVEDHVGNNIRHFVTFGYLDDVVRKWGTTKPSIFIRGNHDVWGQDTYQYGDYFPQPDGKTYFALRQGPALFVTVDLLWTPKEKLQKEQHLAYLKEQADWIRAMKKTPMWKTAKFRVVMMHIAPFPGEGCKWIGEAFNDVFLDESKDGRIHALVTGHEHLYARFNPNSNESHFNNAYGDVDLKKYPPAWFLRDVIPERFPYVEISCHLGEAMTVDVSPEKLTFKSHRFSKPEGGFYDAFELYPDGKVKDLVETVAVPFVTPEKK